mmetsp:Transcript_82722/g.159864  ORF Transcript_82722/g.159864 Transcript_82722/m.159864 type:complete len:255 (+) Transcript_82722:301-1065(+)
MATARPSRHSACIYICFCLRSRDSCASTHQWAHTSRVRLCLWCSAAASIADSSIPSTSKNSPPSLEQSLQPSSTETRVLACVGTKVMSVDFSSDLSTSMGSSSFICKESPKSRPAQMVANGSAAAFTSTFLISSAGSSELTFSSLHFLEGSDDLPLSGNFCIFRVLRTLFLLNKPKKSQYPGTQCQHTREYYHSVEHANGRQNEERDAQVHAYKFNLVEKQRRYAERRRHTALEYGWVGLLHYGRQPLLWSTRC